MGGGRGLRREISAYPSPSQGHHRAVLLASLARGPLIEDNAPILKGVSCAWVRGRQGPGAAVGSGARPLPPNRDQRRWAAGGTAVSPTSPAGAAFPGHSVPASSGEKKSRHRLNRTLLPRALPVRGRGQDPNRLAVSAGGGGGWGMCEIITSTQLKITRLPQSRAASLPLPAERVPGGQRPHPALPGAPLLLGQSGFAA